MQVLKTLSWLALGLSFIPCVLFFVGAIDLDMTKRLSLIGTIAWFVITPLWMGRTSATSS